MKIKIKKKQIVCTILALLIATCTSGILTEAKVVKVQEKMADEVFRFHVLANSDSEEDQALKMLVKENVIAYMKEELPESESVEMTKNWAAFHLEEIEAVATETLQKEGCSDSVHAEVTNCYFPDKTYGDITFPQGYYDALRIEIGEAKGQNWWCVLYPNLCFVDAIHAVVPDEGKEELKEVLDEEEYEMVTATSKFKIRWFFFR
ncbi:MAG: stage II sporulation protein R [Tyzzerella sp.]|nr:stage II sporulation protein R [Tyzzerella sp.]